MANAVYPLYKQSILNADANVSLSVDTATDGPFCSLVTTSAGYTYSAAHQFFSSVTNVVGTDQRITVPTVVNGTFDGNDCTYTAVSGTVVGALVIYRHNAGANTTWRLVLYEDTGVTGLPVTPNGGNIVITWNASGIFTISDRRLKEDVRLLALLCGLPLYAFRYRGQAKRQVGFMAQEVEQLVPKAVRSLGGYKAVDYGRALEQLAA